MKTKIVAAFCGVGKTFTYSNKKLSCIELECWKYDLGQFPMNYIEDIFISTNPVVLRDLYKDGIVATLVYPSIELKSEYMLRYRERGSEESFINMIDVNWDNWLNELNEQTYCKQIILKSGEYLIDYIK